MNRLEATQTGHIRVRCVSPCTKLPQGYVMIPRELPHTHTLLRLDAAYRGNVAVCVCASVFVGIRERLHSFLCMCVSELSGQILGTFESLNFSLTS